MFANERMIVYLASCLLRFKHGQPFTTTTKSAALVVFNVLEKYYFASDEETQEMLSQHVTKDTR